MDQEVKRLKKDDAGQHIPWIVPHRMDLKLTYFLSLLSSWICLFLFGEYAFSEAKWLIGNTNIYLDLWFAQSAWVLFSPFLIYSSISMLLLLWDSDKFINYWFVRLGIYGGFVLALSFIIQLLFIADLRVGLIYGYLCLPLLFGLSFLISLIIQLATDLHGLFGYWAMILILVALFIFVITGSLMFNSGLGIIIIVLLVAGAVCCPILAGITAIRLLFYIEPGQFKSMGMRTSSIIAWLATYSSVRAVSIGLLFDLYTKSPPSLPDCYIATASVKGHPSLVSPSPVRMQNGEIMQVTRQLQILKAGELVLREWVPKVHRVMRWVYDRIGPKLAQRIQGPWSADVGYLFFKPFELITLFLLKRLLPNQIDKIERFYKGECDA